MAVPERRGLSKPPSIKARRAEVAPGGFNWPELGREEIPAALRMILPCLRLRSPLGLVASRGRGQDTGDPRHVGGLRFGLAMGRRSEEQAFTGCMLRANSAWFVGWGGLDLVISL